MDQFSEGIQKLIDEIFGISLTEVLMQLLVTCILIFVIRVFLWKNVQVFIQKRKEYLENEVSEAAKANNDAQRLLEERNAELSRAKEDAKVIITDAKTRAKKDSIQIIEQANTEVKHKLDLADAQIQQEVVKAKSEVKDAIVEIAFEAAEKIVEREINKDLHKDLIDKYIEVK